MKNGACVVHISGTLGRDPEERSYGNGNSMANMSVAVSEYIKKKGEEKGENKTAWYNLTCFGNQAGFVLKHAKKGDFVVVVGKLNISKKDEKTYVNIVVDTIDIVPSSGGQKQEQPGGNVSHEKYDDDSEELPSSGNFIDGLPF
jgi:single-strand DNA-binding protein